MSVSWDDLISFHAFASFCESVNKERNKQKRTARVAKFLGRCRVEQMKEQNSSLFPVMRLLLPAIDRERGAYGIKETLLAKIYIDMLGLGPTSTDAMKLKNYRASKSGSDSGDFAAVLFSVIKGRHYGNAGLSIKKVNDSLDEIIAANLNDGRKGVERVLMDLFKQTTDIQQMWLVRIILKDMKLGMGQKSLLFQFHPDANDLFDVNANLRKVCELLRDPNRRSNELDVQLFTPFKPMLADRCSFKELEKQMGGRSFYIEVKYDGERMQLHKNGSEFRFFSRNGFDFTADFGHDADNRGMFCSYAARSLAGTVKSVILDGEICAFNKTTQTLAQKGDQMNIRGLRDDNELFQQCLCVYDVVFLNGEVLSNRPLKERLEILSTIIIESPGRVQLAQRKTGNSRKQVVEELNDAIDRLEEGIVVKDPNSVYKPNARTRGGWIKVKPDYEGSLVDKCDLIIMGGYYGSGRRTGTVTHFLMGLAVKNEGEEEGGSHPREFHSFCRVGSGCSAKELADLMMRLQTHFKPSTKPPPGSSWFNLEFGREKPDLWIEPSKSAILQVKAAEIVSSNVYKTGCTLRFPRIECVRSASDKPWHACMTVDEMRTLQREGQGKLAGRARLNEDEDYDGGSSSAKRRRKQNASASGSSAPTVSALYRSAVADPSSVMVRTHDLKDKIIVVEPCDGALKARLEEIVMSMGGRCEQNVREGVTFCYVETGFKVRAKNEVRSGRVDVVRSTWLLDCEKDGFRNFRPSDMLYTTSATKERFAADFDIFGDPYAERATEASLKFSMEAVAQLGMEAAITTVDLAEFESTFMDEPLKIGLFRQLRVYCCDKKEDNVAALTLEFYGAVVTETLADGITHALVTSPTAKGTVEKLKSKRRKMKRKFRIVTDDWIDACLRKGDLLDERDFEL